MSDLVKRLAKVFNPAYDKMPKNIQEHCEKDVAAKVLPIVLDDMRKWLLSKHKPAVNSFEIALAREIIDAYEKDQK